MTGKCHVHSSGVKCALSKDLENDEEIPTISVVFTIITFELHAVKPIFSCFVLNASQVLHRAGPQFHVLVLDCGDLNFWMGERVGKALFLHPF